MYVEVDDKICTMLRLCGFGEVQYQGYSENVPKSNTEPSFSSVEEFSEKLISRLEDLCDDEGYWLTEYASILACTTRLQPVSASVLKEFGFTRIDEYQSGRYPNNPATYWIMSIPDVLARLGRENIGA